MANINKYPLKDFSTSQKFLAGDNTGTTVRVSGQSMLDANIESLKASGKVVNSIDTLTEAIAGNYQSGIYLLVGGGTVTLDGDQAIYRVSDAGSGGIVMANGNELVLLFVANTPANIVTPIASVANLFGLTGVADQQISVGGYQVGSIVGGGTFSWGSGIHNGGTFIDPARAWPDWGVPAEVTAWYLNTGLTVDGWERAENDSSTVSLFSFGLTETIDFNIILSAALSVVDDVTVPETDTNFITVEKFTTTSSNKTIRGFGYRSKIIATISADNVIEFVGASNISVLGIHIYLGATTGGSISQGSGVQLTTCTDSVVKDCFFYNGARSAIQFKNTTFSRVQDNNIYGSSVDPANATSDWGPAIYLLDSSTSNIITNNYINGNVTGIACQSVVLGTNPKNNIIDGNTINDSYAYGILCYRINLADGADNNVISNNIIKRVRGSIFNVAAGDKSFGAGIYLQGASFCVVSGNEIESTNEETDAETLAPAAIGATNTTQVTIRSNVIRNANWYGIVAFDPLDAGPVNGNSVISGNMIDTVGKTGIYLKDRDNVNIIDNIIRNCTASGIRTTSTNTTLRDGHNISKNHIIDSGSIAILCEWGARSLIEGNIINDATTTGISVGESLFCQVLNNVVRNALVRGIQIQSTSDNSVVENNMLQTNGIGLLIQSKTRQSNNLFSGNSTNESGTYNGSNDDGAATPTLDGRDFVRLIAGSNITYFTGEYKDQSLFLYATTARTIVHGTTGTSIRLNGSVNFVMAAGDVLVLKRNNDGRWDETSRKVA